jgi:tetratricopeptide (TPR) repeat protein
MPSPDSRPPNIAPPRPPIAAARGFARAGSWGEVLNLLAHVAEGALEPEQITLVAEALLRTARAREAEAWLRRALPDVERSGDWIARRRAVNLWGAALFELGELNTAELAFRRALELGEQEDDPLLVARAMNNLGQIANVRGRPADALVFYKLSVPAYQRLGHPRGLAETYHNMAISYRDLGELDRADECEQRAIEFARAAPVARLAALARIGRADLAFRRGDVALARTAALRGATECLGLGDPAGTADGLRIVGLACIANGEFADAASALERASAFATRQGSPVLQAETLRARAQLAAARGYIDEARRHAQDALALFTKAGATTDHTALTEWYAGLDGRADDAPSTPQGDLP